MINKKQDEPPLIQWIKPERGMVIWIVSVALILISSILFLCFARVPEEEIDNINFQFERVQESPLHITKDGLIAQAPAYNVSGEPRATLIERIIWCESKNCPTAQNPKSTAYGICQFIDGTWDYVQEKWNIKLDRHNYYDQYYACERLLKEEGTKHWKESKFCWSK